MIGNDIVDLFLAKIESNWKREGFLNKIFTKNEQLLISNATNPEVMVWDLWSRKEAAYKIYNRQTGIRAFIPLKLECFDVYSEIGKVICDEHIYFTKTEITGSYIHTIAVVNTADFENVLFLDTSVEIIKRNGIPYIPNQESFVSISHHGDYHKIVVLPDYLNRH